MWGYIAKKGLGEFMGVFAARIQGASSKSVMAAGALVGRALGTSKSPIPYGMTNSNSAARAIVKLSGGNVDGFGGPNWDQRPGMERADDVVSAALRYLQNQYAFNGGRG